MIHSLVNAEAVEPREPADIVLDIVWFPGALVPSRVACVRELPWNA